MAGEPWLSICTHLFIPIFIWKLTYLAREESFFSSEIDDDNDPFLIWKRSIRRVSVCLDFLASHLEVVVVVVVVANLLVHPMLLSIIPSHPFFLSLSLRIFLMSVFVMINQKKSFEESFCFCTPALNTLNQVKTFQLSPRMKKGIAKQRLSVCLSVCLVFSSLSSVRFLKLLF